jgi:hypothetical protein
MMTRPTVRVEATSARVAAGEVDEEAVGEVRGLVGGQPRAQVQYGQELVSDPGRGDVAGRGRSRHTPQGEVQIGPASREGEEGLGAAAEVVVDAVRVAGEGNPAHRVREIPVETGKETEAVFARQRLAPTARRPRDVHGAGLAAEDVVVLVDGHGVAPLGEFVRGAEAGDAAAEDGDALAGGGARAPGP